jgi:uncharacterized protein
VESHLHPGRAVHGPSLEWPAYGLDLEPLREAGWRPTPFSDFVLKIHSRCNLACDYCYVYQSVDQSWRARPAVMAEATLRQVGQRIAQHIERHGLTAVSAVLHGGEPLLAGSAFLDFAARELRAALPASCKVSLTVQTNGVLLNRRLLDLLSSHNIGIAVSLDGAREGHDLHRRYANGRSSYPQVMRGLRLLAESYRSRYRGLLCTVDVRTDPVACYEALLETSPPAIDFLLPHGNWSDPPPFRQHCENGSTPYADWLIQIFDRWYKAPFKTTGIRIFEEILNTLLGGGSRSENIGLSPVAVLVLDTDGSLQQVDTLKTTFEGAPETGLNVFDHDFEAALQHTGVAARQIGLSALSPVCMGCSVRDACGGGAYVHRYKGGEGFRNPSVYCADLRKLIEHISAQVRRDLALLSSVPE